jgi:hypothetical protein
MLKALLIDICILIGLVFSVFLMILFGFPTNLLAVLPFLVFLGLFFYSIYYAINLWSLGKTKHAIWFFAVLFMALTISSTIMWIVFGPKFI